MIKKKKLPYILKTRILREFQKYITFDIQKIKENIFTRDELERQGKLIDEAGGRVRIPVLIIPKV